MSKNISIDEVKRLAELSQIKIDDAAATSLASQMDEILAYVKQLESVDTEGIEPTSHVGVRANAERPDEPIDYGVVPSQLLENAVETTDNYIKTKRIL